MEEIAVLADIHGNRWALEAVLEDLESRAIHRVFNLGDCFYGPLDPVGCFSLLGVRNWPTVRGNQDRVLLEPPSAHSHVPTWNYCHEQLGEDGRRWLAQNTEPLLVEGPCLLCHGTPRSDTEYLLEDVTEEGVLQRSSDEIENILRYFSLGDRPEDMGQAVVLCGHSHVPGQISLSDGRIVINPGSVGLPAYDDDSPYFHVMETGSPHARYVVLRETEGRWSPEWVKVDYDFTSAAEAAAANGRPDWAQWLGTGLASMG